MLHVSTKGSPRLPTASPQLETPAPPPPPEVAREPSPAARDRRRNQRLLRHVHAAEGDAASGGDAAVVVPPNAAMLPAELIAPGEIITVDAPHAMVSVVPDEIADAVRDVIAASTLGTG